MKIAVERLAAVTAALAALARAGCGDESAASVKSGLSGRSFDAVAADGIELPLGSSLQLSFDGLGIRMSGGCNTGTADYDITDDLLIVTSMGLTEMACEPLLMALDTAVVELLTSKPKVELDGNLLKLTGGGLELRLTDDVVDVPDRTLDDTLWVVSTVFHLDTAVGGFGGAKATIRFHGDSADVNGGCNSGSVAYTADDTSIEFGAIGLTKMACEQAAMELEFSVATVLSGTVTYRIEGDELTLLNGDSGLVLEAAADA